MVTSKHRTSAVRFAECSSGEGGGEIAKRKPPRTGRRGWTTEQLQRPWEWLAVGGSGPTRRLCTPPSNHPTPCHPARFPTSSPAAPAFCHLSLQARRRQGNQGWPTSSNDLVPSDESVPPLPTFAEGCSGARCRTYRPPKEPRRR